MKRGCGIPEDIARYKEILREVPSLYRQYEELQHDRSQRGENLKRFLLQQLENLNDELDELNKLMPVLKDRTKKNTYYYPADDSETYIDEHNVPYKRTIDGRGMAHARMAHARSFRKTGRKKTGGFAFMQDPTSPYKPYIANPSPYITPMSESFRLSLNPYNPKTEKEKWANYNLYGH